jgi:hypothetical protein
MNPADVSWVIWFVAGTACFVAGTMCGIRSERNAWKSRANGTTSYYCDGEFFAVLTEHQFVTEYARRPVSPPQGGSGTAPPQKEYTGA